MEKLLVFRPILDSNHLRFAAAMTIEASIPPGDHSFWESIAAAAEIPTFEFLAGAIKFGVFDWGAIDEFERFWGKAAVIMRRVLWFFRRNSAENGSDADQTSTN